MAVTQRPVHSASKPQFLGFEFTRKIKFMIQKKQGNIEKTEMTNEFTTERQNYIVYKDTLLELTNALEAIIQPQETASKEEESISESDDNEEPLGPIKELAGGIYAIDEDMKDFETEKAQEALEKLKEAEQALSSLEGLGTGALKKLEEVRKEVANWEKGTKVETELERAGHTVYNGLEVVMEHQEAMTTAIQPLKDFQSHFKKEFEKKMQDFDT